jgi:hypothetical protein
MTVLAPISIEELQFAASVATRARSGELPVNLTDQSLTFVNAVDGTSETLRPDNPDNRVLLGILEAYRGADESHQLNVMWRVLRIDDFVDWEMCAQHVMRKEKGRTLLSQAFLHAVATCPMRIGREVNKSGFIRALKEGERLYPEDDESEGLIV